MNIDDKINTFKKELDFINNSFIYYYTREALMRAPEYFWEVSASSTGQYHSTKSQGEGGLITHVKSAVFIANDLLHLDMYKKIFSAKTRDYIIAALILHDCCKRGDKDKPTEYTVFDHPILAKQFLYKLAKRKIVSKKYARIVGNLIASHQGQWNTSTWNGEENIKLPLPKTKAQKFIHLCDYIASRKYIEIDYNSTPRVIY